jgi:tRNA (guanine-N7-)-methyltransferase
MRMRKKAWAPDFLAAQPNVSFQAESLKTSWTTMAQDRPLHLELGSGKGEYIHQMATLYPECFWIAVEKDLNVAATALRKHPAMPENVFWIVGDAAHLTDWFNVHSIDRIYLNFSDPWPKKHHAKRRLSSNHFLENMLRILKPDAHIAMKTDNAKLFEYTLMLWQDYPLKLVEFSVNYRRDEHPEDAISEYEQRFMALNQPIFRAVWRKQS